MPNYSIEGKQMYPLSEKDFLEGMKKGTFKHRKHKGLVALLYYTAVRISEALRTTKEQFKVTDDMIIWNVGTRLKHGMATPPLSVPRNLPYADDIVYAIHYTRKGKRLFPYCRKTGYNIVRRAFKYPHFFRLSRITNFFKDGWTIAQVRTWTGLSLNALNFYSGIVDIQKMSQSLR